MWYWWLTNDGRDAHLADHNGDELPNSPWTNPDGWTWDGAYPDAAVDVMIDHAVRQVTENADAAYFAQTVADAIKDNIQQGQP
jgi:hypothetical protein